jgi:hypothetical protein
MSLQNVDAVRRLLEHFMATMGRGSGVGLERQDGAVFTMRNGKVTTLDYYNSRAQALEGAGLAQ